MNRHIPSLIAITTNLLLLVACGNREDAPPTKAGPSASTASSVWPSTLPTDRGTFEVTVSPKGGKIERNKHFSLDVSLVAKTGDTKNVAIVVDADMPAHRHGMNTKPEITAEGPDHYRIDGMVFHMAGDWVITVDVVREGTTERASFPVSVE